jgi:hypothetical protein
MRKLCNRFQFQTLRKERPVWTGFHVLRNDYNFPVKDSSTKRTEAFISEGLSNV